MLLVAATAANFAVAQNAKVTTASNYLRQGDLMKAKSAIDAAAVHVKTQGKPKTELYKGKVYYAIAMDTTAKTAAARPGALETAKNSFLYAKKNDDGRVDMAEVTKYLLNFVYPAYYNRARNAYSSKDFIVASESFAACGEIKMAYQDKNGNPVLDTAAWYYAGSAALAAKEYDKSIEYLNKIAQTDFEDGAVFARMASAHLAKNDTASAMAVMADGRSKFPDNQDLLIKEFNLYVEMGKNEDAIANINQALAQNPDNDAFVHIRGKLKESTGDLEGALADYKKALEINPENKDANYDLGAYYVNGSIEVVEKMNALPLSAEKEYQALKSELDGMYKSALPYLEKAYAVDPENEEVKTVLMQLYSKVGMLDKYQELKNK